MRPIYVPVENGFEVRGKLFWPWTSITIGIRKKMDAVNIENIGRRHGGGEDLANTSIWVHLNIWIMSK